MMWGVGILLSQSSKKKKLVKCSSKMRTDVVLFKLSYDYQSPSFNVRFKLKNVPTDGYSD